MSRAVKLAACSSTAVASILSFKTVYAKEKSAEARTQVWMMGSKYAIPNGSRVDLDRPTPIAWFSGANQKWRKITTGPHFGASLNTDGKVYVWSYSKLTDVHNPPRLLNTKNVTDLVCSEDFIVVIENAGANVAVYDPLTLECISTIACNSSSWLKSNKFVKVSAGRRHVALLDSQGQVWTFGDNAEGQCGRPIPKSKKNIDRFNHFELETQKPVDFSINTFACVARNASDVVCGGKHTVVISSEGKASSFGDDSKIQLGLGDTRSQDMPDYVPHSGMGKLDPEVTDMGKLFQNTMPAVKYTFYDRHLRWKLSDMKIPSEEKISGAVLGDNFTIVKIGDAGLMLACGENQVGQCGRGLNKQQQTFAPVKLPRDTKPVEVSCGSNHCVASLEDGSVHAWGANNAGQLGTGSRASACPPVVVHRSKIRGPLVRDIITMVGKEPDRSQEAVQEFLEERQRDAVKVESLLTKDLRLPQPPTEPVEKVSSIKQDLLAAIDRSREELIMTPQEQAQWTPVNVHASFNNSIIVMTCRDEQSDNVSHNA